MTLAFSAANGWPQELEVKSAIPAPEVVDAQRELVRQEYRADYLRAQANADERRELLGKLLRAAGFSVEDPALRYGILLEALDQARLARDVERVLQVIETLDGSYSPVDVRGLTIQCIVEIAPGLRRSQFAVTAALGLDLAEESIQLQDAASAEQLLVALSKSISEWGDKALKDRRKACSSNLQELQGYLAALEQLRVAPEDPEANGIAGHYEAFRLGDLELGLARLALAPAGELTECARSDIAAPEASQARQELGDRWLAWSKGQDDRTKAMALGRAKHWYELAVLGAGPLQKPRIEDALKELEKLRAGAEVPPPRASRSGSPTRRGLEPGVRRAVDRAVAWLVSHQSEDGHWDSDGFGSHCGVVEGEACSGDGASVHDVSATALATLALMSSGNDSGNEAVDQAVIRGMNWLHSQQEEGGLVGGRIGHGWIYRHAVATQALVLAHRGNPNLGLEAACRKAVAFILAARNVDPDGESPGYAWRYEVPPNGENDTSVTGWMVAALKLAERTGIPVDQAAYANAYAGATAWLNEVTDRASGRCGYDTIGSLASSIPHVNDHYPAQKSEAMTAVALLCRSIIGQDPQGNKVMEQHAKLLLEKLPVWVTEPKEGGSDLYYWYYGTEAMYAWRSKSPNAWRDWYGALKTALLSNQEQGGHEVGSWDPSVCPWGYSGGRIYSTSLAVLALTRPAR